MSLRARILLIVLVATLTPTVVLGLYFLNERDHHIEEAKHSLRALANYAVENLDDKVSGTVQLLHGLSRAPDIDTTEKVACSEFLAGVLAHYPQYTGLLTITPDGDLFCDSLRSGRKLNVGGRDYFRQVRASLEPAFDVVVGGLTGIAVLQVAYPVLNHKGTLKYVLLASLNLSEYAQSFAAASHYPSISVLIWNRKGILMVHKPDGGRADFVGEDFAGSELFRFVASGNTGMSAALPGLDGGHRVWALGVMPEPHGGGARIVLGISQDMLALKANKNLRDALALLFVVSLLAFTLAWYVAETGIRRRVRSIASVARLIGTDDRGARSGPPYPVGELGELMAVVDRTAETVQVQQKELAASNRDLQQANKAKDEFLTVISHELRTPMNVIRGYLGILRENLQGELTAEQSQSVEIIEKRSEDLLVMINSIIEVSLFHTDLVLITKKPINPAVMLDDLKSRVALPSGKTMEIGWCYDAELPTIVSDEPKLKRILEILIDNAIKFTAAGAVSISAKFFADKKAVLFKVADTGIGIPEESRSQIFERFHQVDNSLTREHEGLGLGLYIAKQFADLIGAEINLESEMNKGSIFTVAVPTDVSLISIEPSQNCRSNSVARVADTRPLCD
jgi:signal transduction histidine kinase